MEARRILITITLVLLVIFSGVTFPVRAEASYKIGVILSTTGKYASLGQDEKNAVLLLLDEINKSGGIRGNKIELITEDDESNAAKAGGLARKLITEDNVIGIIGSSGIECSHVIAIECEKRKIPQICIVPTPSVWKGKRWVFTVLPSEYLESQVTSP